MGLRVLAVSVGNSPSLSESVAFSDSISGVGDAGVLNKSSVRLVFAEHSSNSIGDGDGDCDALGTSSV